MQDKSLFLCQCQLLIVPLHPILDWRVVVLSSELLDSVLGDRPLQHCGIPLLSLPKSGVSPRFVTPQSPLEIKNNKISCYRVFHSGNNLKRLALGPLGTCDALLVKEQMPKDVHGSSQQSSLPCMALGSAACSDRSQEEWIG